MNKVIEYIQRLTYEYDKVCIVLPNKRAGLFLKKRLGEQIDSPVWAPGIFSIEDFFISLSEIELHDNTSLCFDLYKIYKDLLKENASPLEEFLKWAPALINDFSEVDSYNVKGDLLFGNLSEIKALESWSLGQEELTDFQRKYLEFWHLLKDMYKNYRAYLLQHKRGYQGLIQRTGFEKIEDKIRSFQWEHYIFAGFNALNACEEQLIAFMLDSGKGHVIWDSDEYYFKNKQQEAGKFLRKYEMLFGKKTKAATNISFINDDLFGAGQKEITITGAAKNILQAKLAGDIVKKILSDGADINNTALVLADENLLFPTLSSVPVDIGSINVTMGYPLKHSLVAELCNTIFDLHTRPSKLGKKGDIFYHRDIIKFLKHPYIKAALSRAHCYEAASKLIDRIQNKSIVFISNTHIEKSFSSAECTFIPELLKPWKTTADAIVCLQRMVHLAAENNKEVLKDDEKGSITMEFLSAFMSVIKRVISIQEEFGENINIPVLYQLITQFVKNSTVPFYGEPLNGLQIMGMLETRTLDFENVLLLSANEGILPSGKKNNSFIPHDIRKAFGLPTYSDKDSIFAYHFYRLIQRAKRVHILYNTETDEFGSGEKSRFITQLINDLPAYNNQIVINEQTLNSSTTILRDQIIKINKTKEIEEKIKSRMFEGLSPSSLNTFRNCSLRFYFQSIAGIKEKEEVEETIGADMLGNIVHKTLQTLYQPYHTKILESADLDAIFKKCNSYVEKTFEEEDSIGEITTGKNLLITAVAKKIIYNFIKSELKFVGENSKKGKQLIIRELEKELKISLQINNNQVTIKGVCDRVDTVEDMLRIIDYKTGSVLPKELKLNDWAEIKSNIELNKSFQLLTYALLYSRNNDISKYKLTSGIISFRGLTAGLQTVEVSGDKVLSNETLKKFEQELIELLEGLMDTSVPFLQTENRGVCEYCPYKSICNR